MIDKEIKSSYLNETMTLRIYQPESFSSLYKYHVCIMQDGNDYYQIGRVATLSDRLHSDMGISNTIFVGIHYQDKFDRWKKYHSDGEQNIDYINFLVHEVVSFLYDMIQNYNIGQTRTLMGDSLASTLALLKAFKYPNTFGKVIMQSPYVNETVLKTIKQTDAIQPIDIYHTIGQDETAVSLSNGNTENFINPNRELKELLYNKNVTYNYHDITN